MSRLECSCGLQGAVTTALCSHICNSASHRPISVIVRSRMWADLCDGQRHAASWHLRSHMSVHGSLLTADQASQPRVTHLGYFPQKACQLNCSYPRQGAHIQRSTLGTKCKHFDRHVNQSQRAQRRHVHVEHHQAGLRVTALSMHRGCDLSQTPLSRGVGGQLGILCVLLPDQVGTQHLSLVSVGQRFLSTNIHAH